MKLKILTLSFLALFVAFNSIAQDLLEVEEIKTDIADGRHNAFAINIYGADEKDIEKEWKRLMKDYDAEDVDRKKEVIADDVTIKDISPNTVDVYAKVEKEDGDKHRFIVAFNLGMTYLNSSEHSAAAKSAEKLLYEFAFEVSREALSDKLDDKKDELEDLQKDQEKLVKDKEKLQDDIEGWKKDIGKAEKDIEKNIKDQEEKKEAISNQQKEVEKAEKRIKNLK